MKDAVHRHKVYSDSGSNIRSGVHSTTGRVGGVGAVGTKAVWCATVLLIASGVCASPSGDITWATLGRKEDTGEDLVSYASEEAMLEYYGINIGDAVASSPTIKKRGSTAMVHNRADVIENISGWTSYTLDWVTKTCVAIILSTATLALGSRFILWTAQNYQGIRAIIGSGSQSNQLTAAPMDVKRRSQGGVVTAVIKMDSIEDFTNADKQVTHTRAYQLNFDNMTIAHLGDRLNLETPQTTTAKRETPVESWTIGVGLSGPSVPVADYNSVYNAMTTQLRQVWNTGSEGCGMDYNCNNNGCLGIAIQASTYYGSWVHDLWGQCYNVPGNWKN